MSFIETAHTTAAIEKIKKELSVMSDVINFGSMAVFAIYYPYLIYKNISSIPHLVAYIILFVCAIVAFSVGLAFRDKSAETRHEEMAIAKKKKRICLVTKTIKFLAKGVTVALALSAVIKNPETNVLVLSTLMSCGIFCAQVIFEIIVFMAKRYIEFVRIGIDMDIAGSGFNKLIQSKGRKAEELEKELYDTQGIDYYSEEEQKIRQFLGEEAQNIKVERDKKEEERENKYKQNKQSLKDLKKRNRIIAKQEEKDKKALHKQTKEEEKKVRKEEKQKEKDKGFQELLDTPEIAEN